MLNHSKKGKSKGTIGTLLAGGDSHLINVLNHNRYSSDNKR